MDGGEEVVVVIRRNTAERMLIWFRGEDVECSALRFYVSFDVIWLFCENKVLHAGTI